MFYNINARLLCACKSVMKLCILLLSVKLSPCNHKLVITGQIAQRLL